MAYQKFQKVIVNGDKSLFLAKEPYSVSIVTNGLSKSQPNLRLENQDLELTLTRDEHSMRRASRKIDIEDQNQNQDFCIDKIAISVQNGCKKFGSKEVLRDLDMEVKEGAIYALLGASGCGKTTLLSCILGLKKLDKGLIEIFGYKPGSKESGVPGNRVGHMPQELSLFEEFSIKEVIFYFGRIYGMKKGQIQERMTFILKLLKLTEENKLIRNLSGGQQRRVSFAVSLIHDSQILILDEPTVGVDPLLRQTIWDYLKSLVISNKTTIIVTTHYIQEAEHSSMVGIMRNGRLLAQDEPALLKQEFNTDLEKIVLQLCLQDEDTGKLTKRRVSTLLSQNDVRGTRYALPDKNKEPWKNNDSGFCNRIQALIIRNFIRMYRNIGFIFFLLFFPGAGVFLVCLAVGGEIRHLNFGYVNLETGVRNCDMDLKEPNYCTKENISCYFPNFFPNSKLNWKYYLNEYEALDDSQRGQIWGYILIPENFSEIFPSAPDTKVIVKMDATNQLVSLELQKNIMSAYEKFADAWFENCTDMDPNDIKHPISFTELYGGKETNFTEFIAPSGYDLKNFFLRSVHLLLILFMGVALTGLVLILEKKAGMYERSIVAGVSQNEVVFSHFSSQYGVMLLQAMVSFFILFYGFDLPIKGPIWAILLITIMQGSIGILIGFVISTICNEESSVLQLAIAIIMPLFMLSGVVWPVEGMPDFLRYISYVLPQGLAAESTRSIMSRGWGFCHQNVWPGFALSGTWILILILTILLLNKFINKIQ